MGRPLENVVNDKAQLSKSKSKYSSVQGKKLQECPAAVQAQLAVSHKQFINKYCDFLLTGCVCCEKLCVANSSIN